MPRSRGSTATRIAPSSPGSICTTRTAPTSLRNLCSPTSAAAVWRGSTMGRLRSPINRSAAVISWLQDARAGSEDDSGHRRRPRRIARQPWRGTHGYFVYDSVLHVPLIVATPFEDLRGVRVDAQVSLADIFPTVFALAGIEVTRARPRSLAAPVDVSAAGPAGLCLRRIHGARPAVLAGARFIACGRLATNSSARHGRSCTTSRRTLKRATNIADREQGVAREMSRELEHLIDETSHGAPAPEAANLDRDTVAAASLARLRGARGCAAEGSRSGCRRTWPIPRTS